MTRKLLADLRPSLSERQRHPSRSSDESAGPEQAVSLGFGRFR